MARVAIDTLGYARRLRDAGIDSAQAEAMSEALAEELTQNPVTKSDLESALADLKIFISERDSRLMGWLLVGTATIVAAVGTILKLV